MGCGCNKDRPVIATGSGNKTQDLRTNKILEKNFGTIKNPADKARKIAILKRLGKL